jgi:hypothetical protein
MRRSVAITLGASSGFVFLCGFVTCCALVYTRLPQDLKDLVKTAWVSIPLLVVAVCASVQTGLSIYHLVYLPTPARLYLKLISFLIAGGLLTGGLPFVFVMAGPREFRITFEQARNQSLGTFAVAGILSLIAAAKYDKAYEKGYSKAKKPAASRSPKGQATAGR